MSWLRRFLNRWREDTLRREFDAELGFDLERRTVANIRRGMDADDAAREARRRFGNVTRAREDMRAARVATWFDGLDCDLRYAVRVFARHPLITVLTVLMLSLGIGANAAVFSVFEAVLLRPLPYPAADRLMLLLEPAAGGRGLTTPTVPEALDIRNSSRSFDAVTFFDTRDFQTTGGAEPERVIGARVETSLLNMLGVRALLGRTFDAADSANSSGSIVILGQGFWRRSFGGDPRVVGRTLSLNGEPCEIVGVLPETLAIGPFLPPSIDLYLPYPSSPDYMSRTGAFASVRRVTALGRLRPGVSPSEASAELRTVSAAIAAAHPEAYAQSGLSIVAQPVRELMTRTSRSVMLLLLGLVALMLLIACVNTAQFLLAQSIEREPEIAVRRALGASRSRLVRQCLSEVLLLTFAGGLAGVVQALWLTNVLRTLVPSGMALVGEITLDRTALLVLFFVTLLCAIVSAAVPATRFADSESAGRFELRTTTRGSGRLRHAFIAIEIAMSVVLLCGAALLVRSLYEITQAQSGFSSERVTVLRLRGIGGTLGDTYVRYLEHVARVNGIESVGLSNSVFPGRPSVSFTRVGDTADTATLSQQQATYQIVSGGYFATLGIPLESGRLFTDDDDAKRPRVAIVNREMAQRFWQGNPIGRQVRAGDGPRAATMTIVGVVGNVRPPFQIGDVPQMYVPYRQQSDPNAALIVRTAPAERLPLPAIKQAIWAVEPRQAVFNVETLDAQLLRAVSSQRAIATLTGGFAGLAVVISVCGIYTVVAYLVRRRFKEIAVRRAIGADSRDVLWSLAGPTLRWATVGLLAGAAGAVVATGALRAAIAGIVPLDAALTAAVTASYLLVVLLVVAAAARTALQIDPAAALRIE